MDFFIYFIKCHFFLRSICKSHDTFPCGEKFLKINLSFKWKMCYTFKSQNYDCPKTTGDYLPFLWIPNIRLFRDIKRRIRHPHFAFSLSSSRDKRVKIFKCTSDFCGESITSAFKRLTVGKDIDRVELLSYHGSKLRTGGINDQGASLQDRWALGHTTELLKEGRHSSPFSFRSI
jgi:hypothetical protein